MAEVPGTNGLVDDLVHRPQSKYPIDAGMTQPLVVRKTMQPVDDVPVAPQVTPRSAPNQGAMEAFISSRINSAGGRTMKPGGKAGFLFPSGPYKGMTLEQATEAARQEWSNMDTPGRDNWASKNVTGNRTSAELGSNASPAPFALDAPKFNGGQKVGRDGKAWGLGDKSSPTSSVARGGNSAPATASEEAMLPKPTFAVSKNTGSGPPAPGQVTKSVDGQYGTGSVTFGLPKPTARTGRIFDNGKDVTGQVMDSVAARQPATAVANSGAAPTPTIPPSKYPSTVDAASDAAMQTLVKPLMTPKAPPPSYQTPPLTSRMPNPATHSPVSPFGAGAPPIATKPAAISQITPDGVPSEQQFKTATTILPKPKFTAAR